MSSTKFVLPPHLIVSTQADHAVHATEPVEADLGPCESEAPEIPASVDSGYQSFVLNQRQPLAQVLSTMPLAEWHGSLTTFKGFTGTAPVLELKNRRWKDITPVLCPEKPVILADKKTGQYVVPCLLKEAPLVGRTLEFAKDNFRPTVGKQRSKGHVTAASFIIMDVDGLPEPDFMAGLASLQQADITYLAYTTYSHGRPDKYGMRARVCVPIDTPACTEVYFVAWHGTDALFWQGQAGAKDASGANLYQQQGTWAVNLATVQHARFWHFDGGVASTAALIEIGRATSACQTGVQQTYPVRHDDMGAGTHDTATSYPSSDANMIADRCFQIGNFRDTKGEDQREPNWFDCLGIVGYCLDGEAIAHEWSSGHEDYDEAQTEEKLNYRLKFPPTTCQQFRKSNPAGCSGCTKKCNSPITLGWQIPAHEEFEAVVTEVVGASKTTHGSTSIDAGKVVDNVAHAVQTATVSAPQITEADRSAILALNKKFAFIEEYASIYRFEFGNFIEPPKFRLQHDNRKVHVVSGPTIKSVGLGSAWLGSPNRRQHKSLVMRPGEGLVTADNCLNEWQGFAIAPARGDVRPFLRLLVRLTPNRAARRYIQKWAAHLIQRPGVKMFVSLALWSHAQGVGKNLLFETLVAIIGPTHATVIGQEELSSNFTGWANRRIMVIGDEVSGTDKRQQNDKLKGLITGTAVHINIKFQPDLEQPNLLNFIFLSNHHDALFVNDHDRRFFVWEIEAGRLPEPDANKFVAWRDSGGLAALHHFLLHYPLGDFNPRAPAPMTVAKQQMADDNRSDLEAWIADLLASDIATVFGRDLATANELGKRYAVDTGHIAPSSKAIVGAAKRMGVYARPSQVRLEDGKKARVLALTRIAFWRQQAEPEWAKEMAKPLAHLEL